MKLKKLSIASLFLLSGILFGQAVPESPKGIKANFSMRSIEAYQENSQNKLEEFYEYLSIYSSETNEELKKQIRENILAMADAQMRFRVSLNSYLKLRINRIGLKSNQVKIPENWDLMSGLILMFWSFRTNKFAQNSK